MFSRIQQKYPGIRFANLGIGEICVSSLPLAVSTVLGSCVAVTMFCPVTRTGGLFHALLPERAPHGKLHDAEPCRFVDEGIRELLRQMERSGADMPRLVCKIFGGANAVFEEFYAVGMRNVDMARQVLAEEHRSVQSEDVGGTRGRKLFFITHTGEVFTKKLSSDVCFLPEGNANR
ncbi:chemotaxis protein CheD [Desulfobaculum bizertense]|uniref:Probable chemoreceptor glutamine deamidase CheD n=1 Tax=Desulfobaculum bizertense DSM 18034 TaxID=1121442 RepID=A0A1T4WZQ3_9BACT|nr:chemotaxis protein CheD [Desulfobaculum bizertense]UIJ37352.1 chemotaxis protein CheD [Desulfobaculum bizertense]SKA82820.1 chemotaxis protein CheD [Desulfobaculum bizertense DSM 18034]